MARKKVWENLPSKKTPLKAEDLQYYDDSINNIENDIQDIINKGAGHDVVDSSGNVLPTRKNLKILNSEVYDDLENDSTIIDTKGLKGDAATINIDSVITIEPDENASIENIGDQHDAKLKFSIPRGKTGLTGTAATINVGNVKTVESDIPAKVSNKGNENDAIFDFEIPRGVRGIQGLPGKDGVSPIITTNKVDKVSTITINDASGGKTFEVLDGEDGIDGKSVKSITTTYQTSVSGTSTPTGVWQSTIPTVPKGQYLWMRTIQTLTDNSTLQPIYMVSYQGLDGDGSGDMKTSVYDKTLNGVVDDSEKLNGKAEGNLDVNSASKFKTPRKINGVSFDGTVDIIVKDDTKVALVDVVTTPTANKILKLNSEGKLPSNITGDSATVGGNTVERNVTAEEWTNKQIEDYVNQKLAGVYSPKGSVATYTNLPKTGNVVGDVWNTIDNGMNYAWTVDDTWDALGMDIDLSNYYTKSETFSKTEINAKLTDTTVVITIDPSSFDAAGKYTYSNPKITATNQIELNRPSISLTTKEEREALANASIECGTQRVGAIDLYVDGDVPTIPIKIQLTMRGY